MSSSTVQRHYPIQNLNFRDFWDVCSHFQRTNSEFPVVSYSVETQNGLLVDEEVDVAVVLKKLSTCKEKVRKFVALFFRSGTHWDMGKADAKLFYLLENADLLEPGLYYHSEAATKLSLFKFENVLYSNYEFDIMGSEVDVEFGLPCEVLACVVDMRGFSAFCEQPNIESPYTCGLMTAFYNMVSRSFSRYPPDMMKFLGDGVLTIWQTSPEDRSVAIDVCLDGISLMSRRWGEIRRGPHFTHGAPRDIGSGVSFGLASKISVGNDYIGRPVNIASRLCSVCQPGQSLIDKSVPGLSADPRTKDVKVRIKSFGDFPAWSMLIT